MKKPLKFLVIFLVLVIALFSWSWFSSKKKLADYALKVQPGMQIVEARLFARQIGLKYVASSNRDESGHFRHLVTSSGVMGQYVCEIQYDGTVVVKSTQQFHD